MFQSDDQPAAVWMARYGKWLTDLRVAEDAAGSLRGRSLADRDLLSFQRGRGHTISVFSEFVVSCLRGKDDVW